ncbi:GGDEF domain-containing protein [Vibrio hyugaensis]|uniref:GGDEF domain-containing protein n=2 Tax=Vibrio hyugaensis TaxID=1534743 RepID=UPI003D9FE588
MLFLKLSQKSSLISLAVYVIAVSFISIIEIDRTNREFNSVANTIDLYKTSAVLAGLLMEAKLDNNSNIKLTEEVDTSDRVLSLNDSVMTNSELVAFDVLDDFLMFSDKLTRKENVNIYYRSYVGKKLVFAAAPTEHYPVSERLFDPLICSSTRTCSLNMHKTELVDRLVVSDIYKSENPNVDIIEIMSPVYADGTIIGDFVIDLRISYKNLDGRTIRTELVGDFHYYKIGYDNYPLSNLAGGLILPIDSDTAIVYQLPIIKVLIDNLWVLFVTWIVIWVIHRLYSSNMQHKSHLASAIERASKDELTSLYNRKVFEDKEFENAIKQGRYTVILIDGKKFKQINDTHGHKAGDLALIHIARTMKATFRQSDWLIRFGGDEFVVIMPSCPLDAAERLAERLRESIAERPLTQYDVEVQVTTGVAKATGNESLMDVIELADQDMYRSK